ncbi:tripartite tricarboxylate transporter TctB family protein [Pseudomonas matsuisoli]|uniref:DUF1468 domain-containing protein n=1 Tax=Pseudomonas matsuisoli TaxID=1515666 RepID=A0A917PIE2_9PSED|nr:tripartite tricarboxylate transporter TctB family protein [Pseudomonas matsuisoli]GGJ80448.1 hypothetical protein GCM10009304_02760 [Pseudomonas matsuisoli]
MMLSKGAQRLDVLTGVISLGLSALLFWASLDVKDFGSIGVGASFVPKLTAVLFLLVGLALIGGAFAASKTSDVPADAKPEGEQTTGGIGAVALSVVLMAGYVAALDAVGFMISSVVYVFLQILILCKQHRRRYLMFALTSVVPAVALYYLFVDVFDISLPAGVLG